MPVDNEKKKAQKRKWWKKFYPKHKERILAEKKAYRDSNRGVIRATQKVYRDSDKGRSNRTEHERRRRATKNNNALPLTDKELHQTMLLENTRRELTHETGREYQIDHILPVAHGGIHHPINLRILEKKENISKGDRLLPEAIALAYQHYRLYHDRVGPERAWEFVQQLAKGLRLSNDHLDSLIAAKRK